MSPRPPLDLRRGTKVIFGPDRRVGELVRPSPNGEEWLGGDPLGEFWVARNHTVLGAAETPPHQAPQPPPRELVRTRMFADVAVPRQYPRGESNACLRLRRPSLYPLSYGGGVRSILGRRNC